MCTVCCQLNKNEIDILKLYTNGFFRAQITHCDTPLFLGNILHFYDILCSNSSHIRLITYDIFMIYQNDKFAHWFFLTCFILTLSTCIYCFRPASLPIICAIIIYFHIC
jgi:hypothetical protein